ncbi:MAG: NAD-binding protein [Gammaproteobacteria bacterium]|nr:NAD-binding protein [Gammaproteobacteria bacterium]
MNQRVGFIGLGAMGLGMSINLHRAGFSVRGFDLAAAKSKALEAAGGAAEATAAAAAEGAELLHICVFNAAEAGELLAPDADVMSVLPAGATVVMHTTMAPAEGRALAEGVASGGFDYLEAPVTGGQRGADEGTLTAIVAGSEAAMAAARPALDAMCNRVYRVGERAGAAATVKMINQLLVGVHMTAAAEAMALAVRAGADPNVTFDVIHNGRGNSEIFSARVPSVLAGAPEASRTVEIFLKDLAIVLQAGRDLAMPLPLTANAHQLFVSAAAMDAGGDAQPSMFKLYEALSGIDIAASAAANTAQ